jgi:hypothetical protein
MSSNDQEPQPYQSPEETPLSGKEAYNVVSDTAIMIYRGMRHAQGKHD